MIRICDWCQHEFTTSDYRSRYCPGTACRMAAKRAYQNRRNLCRRFALPALLAATPVTASVVIMGAASARVEQDRLLEHQPRHGASGRN